MKIREYIIGIILLLPGLLPAQDPLTELYYAGSYQEVIHRGQQALEQGDTTYTTYLFKALAEDQLGQTMEAIATLEAGLEVNSGDIRLRRMLATQYMKGGLYVEAQRHFFHLVTRDSLDVSSWLNLAEIASFRQKNEQAVAALEKVLRIDSINLEGLVRMADILSRHNHSGANIYYERAWRHDPGNQKVAYALANWYIKAHEAQRAIPVCEAILLKDSLNIRFHKLLGYALYKSGQAQEASHHLTRATQLGDSTAFTFKFLGISRYLSIEFEPGAHALSLSLAKDSLDAEVHFFLGACLATTTQKKQAMFHLEKSLELMQPDTIVTSRIFAEQGSIRRLEERYEEAYQLYSLSYDTDGTNLMSLYLMASILDNSMHLSEKALVDYELLIRELDKQGKKSDEKDMVSIRSIVEDRIIDLKEELFFLDQ